MVCAEWWAFEIGSFVTGSINELQLATYTIALNLTSAGNQVLATNYGIYKMAFSIEYKNISNHFKGKK